MTDAPQAIVVCIYSNGIMSAKEKGDPFIFTRPTYEYIRADRVQEMIAEEREDADRLERALAVSIEDGMWNAFSLGHVRNDRWHHQRMSDAEELVFALGMNLEDKSWDAADMKAAIPEAAKEKAAAIRAREGE